MKYDIVTAESSSELVEAVNKKLAEGWGPHGAPVIETYKYHGHYNEESTGTIWAQALVREEM